MYNILNHITYTFIYLFKHSMIEANTTRVPVLVPTTSLKVPTENRTEIFLVFTPREPSLVPT
jgi:hypothetical protein